MIKVTTEVIEECAANLMFELSPGQAELMASEFDTVATEIAFLAKIEGVDEAQPMTFPYRRHRSTRDLRADKPAKPLPLKTALRHSHATLGNQISVPKVVAHGEKNPADKGVE